jgi:hypothetical protein
VLSGETSAFSTSHRNRFHSNVMGVDESGTRFRNGVDFWWDEHPNNSDNCWFDNGQVTTDPPQPITPSNCDNTSTGATYASKAPELGGCAGSIASEEYNPDACPWFRDPPRPGDSSAASTPEPVSPVHAARFAELVRGMCDLVGSSTLSCDAFRGQRP